MTMIAKSGFSLATGIGFLSLMAAFWYGTALGVPLKNLWGFSNITHPQLERKSQLIFDETDPNIDPMLARDFVLFVVKDAFDANPSTSERSHICSQGWMTSSAQSVINQSIWRLHKKIRRAVGSEIEGGVGFINRGGGSRLQREG